MANFLRYYFYLVSLITLFAWAIGLSQLIGASLTIPFGYDFTYSISRPVEPAPASVRVVTPIPAPQPEAPMPAKPEFIPLSPEEQGDRELRQQLASAIPLVVIVLPLWVLHWRSAMRNNSLQDKLGRFYLLAVLGTSSLVSVIFATRAVAALIRHYILVPPREPWMPLGPAVGSDIGAALVFSAIWAYHFLLLRQRARDEAQASS